MSCGVVVEIWAWVETSRRRAEETKGRTKVGCPMDEGGDEMAFWMRTERRSEMGRV